MRRIILVVGTFLLLAQVAPAQMTFQPGTGWKAGEPAAGGGELKTDRSDYERALAAYQAGDNKKAMQLADEVIKTYKSGLWVEHAMLLEARTYYRQNDLKRADQQLTLLRKRFPGTTLTREISDLELAIGTTQAEKGKYAGVKMFEEIVESNPYGPRADEAQFRTGQYYMRKGNYLDAAQAFALVASQYKESRFREEALFLRAKCHYLDNEGPARDPLPYVEARDGLSEYLKAYPSGTYVKDAQALQAEIENTLAHKLYIIGEYYRKQGRYRAAERYYQEVLKKYPNSRWATLAGRREPKVKKRIPAEPAAAKPVPPRKPETAPPETTRPLGTPLMPPTEGTLGNE